MKWILFWHEYKHFTHEWPPNPHTQLFWLTYTQIQHNVGILVLFSFLFQNIGQKFWFIKECPRKWTKRSPAPYIVKYQVVAGLKNSVATNNFKIILGLHFCSVPGKGYHSRTNFDWQGWRTLSNGECKQKTLWDYPFRLSRNNEIV